MIYFFFLNKQKNRDAGILYTVTMKKIYKINAEYTRNIRERWSRTVLVPSFIHGKISLSLSPSLIIIVVCDSCVYVNICKSAHVCKKMVGDYMSQCNRPQLINYSPINRILFLISRDH